MATLVKLNKSFVDDANLPDGRDQIFYRDKEIRGFALRVTSSGTKSFVVEKMIGNKIRRITLGKYGALTTEDARKQAQALIGDISKCKDPVAEKKATKLRSITLREVFDDYLRTRKTLKPKTIYDYNRVLNLAFKNWGNKPLTSITKDKVTKLHDSLGKERGKAYANLSMRVLRALFNFASEEYENTPGCALITENPVKRLSKTKAWYHIDRRKTYIKSHELAAWYSAVQQLENITLRDYLILILFTGLRRQEAAKLQWDQVDLKSKTLTVTDTKNNEAHTLPLSDFLFELFSTRKINSQCDYVFPGTGVGGYIIEPRKQIAKVIAASGISFSIHDLRRTFITIAESLDIPAYALKRLLNHKMKNDVTSGYIMTDVERLRKPMQLISDYMLKCMGVEKSADVISIQNIKGISYEKTA